MTTNTTMDLRGYRLFVHQIPLIPFAKGGTPSFFKGGLGRIFKTRLFRLRSTQAFGEMRKS